MHKYTLVVIALLAIFTSSCKKDFNCNCSVSSNLKGVMPSTSTNNIGTMTKKEAANVCEKMSAVVRSGSVATSVTCKIE